MTVAGALGACCVDGPLRCGQTSPQGQCRNGVSVDFYLLFFTLCFVNGWFLLCL